MKKTSTILAFLIFLLAGMSLHAQETTEINKHDLEKMKAFFRNVNNLEEIGFSPSDTLNWNADNWDRQWTPFQWELFDGVLHITRVEVIYATCGCNTPLVFSGYLDLEGCQYLESIDLIGSNIDSLNISNCPNLTSVFMSYNWIKKMQFDNCPKLESIDVGSNQLDFNNLPRKEDIARIPYFNYLPQNPKPIAEWFKINTPYDFDNLGGTEFKWLDYEGNVLDEGKDYIFKDGKTTFLKETESPIRCEATNPAFPDLTISSDYTAVVTKDVIEYDSNDVEKLRLFMKENSNFFPSMQVRASLLQERDPGYVDWKIINSTYRLVSINCVIEKDIIRPMLGNIDFAGCTELRDVILSPIMNVFFVDFSGCGKLRNFHCWVSGPSINLTGCSSLESLNIGVDKSINLKDCPNLRDLQLSGSLYDIDLSKQTKLEKLDLKRTKIRSLVLSECPNLTWLNVSETPISELILGKCANLQYFDCRSASLTFKHLPHQSDHPNLSDCYYDKQNKINISTQPKDKIDLSQTDGTNFEWITTRGTVLKEGVDYTIDKGVTTFLKAVNNVYCKITNPDFPNLTLETTEIRTSVHSIESSTLDEAVDVYSTQAGKIVIVSPVEAEYAVYNLSGNLVTKGTTIETEETIDVLQAGVYLVKIEANNENVTKKVVVK